MNETTHAFRAGLVVVLGVAIAAAFFITTRKSTLDAKNSASYFAFLEDASGINAKSLITVAGLQVGEIQDIRLVRVPLEELAGTERAELEAAYEGLRQLAGSAATDDAAATDATADVRRSALRSRYLTMHAAWVQRHGISDEERAALEARETRETASWFAALPPPPAWDKSRSVPVARVEMRVIPEIRIPEDSWLRKESLGVLGAKALFLDLGESSALIAEGGRITRVRSQTGLDALQGRADAIVASLESITRKIDRDIGGITGDIRGITQSLHGLVAGDGDEPPLQESVRVMLQDLGQVVRTVESAVRDVDRMLGRNDNAIAGLLQNLSTISADVAAMTSDESVAADGSKREAGDIRQAMTRVRQVTEDLAVVSAGLKNLVGTHEGDMGAGVDQLKGSLAELNRSLSSLAEVSGKVERGEGMVGKLLTDERLAAKLDDAVSGASDFVAGITALQTHIDLGTWYNLEQGSARVTFGLKLQPRPDKYYLFEIIEDGGGIERLTRTLRSGTSEGAESTEREVVRQYDNSIRISAMFAKRFWDFLVLRAGLIETSGGVGANLMFWEDRIELRTDVFNFSGPRDKVAGSDPLYAEWALPRWRTLLKVQPLPFLYLTAGVDDVLNFKARPSVQGYGLDYFFGAGLSFQDEDLRSILPFLPSL